MFVSPFTVSVSCDAAIIVIYLQRAGEFGGSPWFMIADGHGFTTQLVDLVSTEGTAGTCLGCPPLFDFLYYSGCPLPAYWLWLIVVLRVAMLGLIFVR